MGFLATIYPIVQGLVFLHQIFITFGLSTIVGIDDHIVIDSLTPDGGSTTGTVVVACSVASVVSSLLFCVGLIDVAGFVQQGAVEVVVRLPLHGIGDGEGLCQQTADTSHCT